MKIITLDLRPVLSILGVFLTGLALTMLVPTSMDLLDNNNNWLGFMMSAALTSFIGVTLILITRGKKEIIEIKSTFLLVTFSWIILSIFSSLPFFFSQNNLGITESFFESVSGLTTTGSTTINNIQDASRGLLLWRAILQWLGGIGIIVSAVSILPSLGVGGMQLFRLESSDSSEKLLPRATSIATEITVLYLFLSGLCAIAYWFSGLSIFDSIIHSMTTIATGGFSSQQGSIGAYNNLSLEIMCILFMIFSSLPFVLYLKAIRGKPYLIFKDEQVQGFFKILISSILIIILYLSFLEDFDFFSSLRSVIFNVTSILTGTGFSTDSYDNWGPPVIVVFLCITFIGGCAGSTTCGIKVFRIQVIFKNSKQMIEKLISPNRVTNHKYNGENLSLEIIESVMTFLFIFILTFFVITLILALTGLDLLTSMSASATSISNVGPGLGNIIGPNYNFSELSNIAKWVLSFGMLAGRLEFLTFLVIFSKSFWK
tara:strand:+ start:5342 stop:6799 length:1458 start_codon:yes stop_codon:yes gene_type:complete